MPALERVAVDGSLMDVHVFEPAGQGSAPLILLMYPRSGFDGFPERIATAFAAEGCRVAAPEISHRQDPAIPIRDRKQFLKDDEIVRDMRAALSLFDAAAPKFILGHCMGGRHAFLGASCIPGIAGAIPYYSADMFQAWGGTATPFDLLGGIKCPVLGFFGGKDKNPAPADVDRIAEKLTAHGIAHTFHRYPEVGHAFQQNAARSPEEKRAADDSTAKTVAFINKVAAGVSA
jgi:carboxymethylenebutenolidase